MDDGDQKKKRKFEVEEEEESEEAKMEKFYELLRISKDTISARMMKFHGERLKMMKKQKGFINIESNRISSSSVNNGGSWNPTFQLEDFIEDHGQKKLQVINRDPIRISCPSSSRINMSTTAATATATATAAGPSNSKKDDKGGDDHNGLNLNLSL